ncbi:MAG: InlB B-repeat-containing protein, partial [Eubacteriales bacterium]
VADGAGVSRTGFILTGWSDASTNEPFDLGATIPAIDRNYALNAVWVRATYSLTYATGTTAPVLRMPTGQTGIYAGDTITISTEIPYYSGYRFLGWSTDDIDGVETMFDPGDSFEMPGNGVTLTAAWQAATSPIYYHPNGAPGVTIEEGRYPTDSDVTIAANPFTRDGFRFIGWSEASPTAGVTRQPGDLITMPPRQLNFYAQWEEGEARYTVTYIVTGGTGDLDGGAYMTYTDLAAGDAMPIPADPTLEGYTFDGWAGDIPATVPGEDVVIYGAMTLIEKPIEEPEEEPEEIPDEQTPLAGGPVWALLNLILAIATALVSIWMLLGLIGRKKDVEDGVVTPATQRRQGVARVLTLLPGIGGIILFLLTENMNNPMVFTDRWTIYMVVIAAVQLLLLVFGVTKGKDKDQDKGEKDEKAWTYDILKGV